LEVEDLEVEGFMWLIRITGAIARSAVWVDIQQ